MDRRTFTQSQIELSQNSPLLIPKYSRANKIKNQRIEEKPNKSSLGTPEIVFITSYPPRQCGIATFSSDLMNALREKYGSSCRLSVLPLENNLDSYKYPEEITSTLNTDNSLDYIQTSYRINGDQDIKLVVVQHEFGLFSGNENGFLEFLDFLDKPVVVTFHTVLPKPDSQLVQKVRRIASLSSAIIVMTQKSADLLTVDYSIPASKVHMIPHGTHLIKYEDKEKLKKKYNLAHKKVLSTFGLLGPGKSIETTLEALPAVVSKFPDTVFLILGRTHPSLVKQEGEKYRNFLQEKVKALGLESHVRFVNNFLPLEQLLEYLQLTDIYLFTSKDPNQAVSGTFSYALSCGCPVISTPIPHAIEVLENGAGKVFDFENNAQLQKILLETLENEPLRLEMSRNGLMNMAATAWENVAISYADIFEEVTKKKLKPSYGQAPLKLDHIKTMTTEVGIIQFSNLNHPDIESGYTLDDNARALIAMCQHYKLTRNESDLKYIRIYFNFVFCCFRHNAKFLNYVDKQYQFTEQNNEVNLEDACGRALWAIGYLLSLGEIFPSEYKPVIEKANFVFEECLAASGEIESPRGIAFAIKGLYYGSQGDTGLQPNPLIKKFADRLLSYYKEVATEDWRWYENYLTYGNSVLSEAMLMAYSSTLDPEYRRVAKESFDFLLEKIFIDGTIRVISNKNWLMKDQAFDGYFKGGEQPIDVAYTVLALRLFHRIFPNEGYGKKMKQAFNWFLGDNPLRQTIYNPCTGGCYDGLELETVNLNQGAESTLSYLLARMAFEDGLDNRIERNS